MAFFFLTMGLLATNLVMATPEANQLEERNPQSGTCNTCVLGGNPYVQLFETIFGGDDQTTDDCRMELYIDMPEEYGGLAGITDGLVRVNFEEDDLACSIEIVTFDPETKGIRCLAGTCSVTEVTDTSATVNWGGCYLVNQNWYTEGQEIKDSDCIPMNGRTNFQRFHGKESGCGNVLAQDVTLNNQVVGLDTILSMTKPDFTGGVVTQCSALNYGPF